VGRTFHFECPHCQYQAHVSGGADAGLNCAIQTIICLDCHRLYDVFTRLRLREDKEGPLPPETGTKATRLWPSNSPAIPPLYLMENSWNDFSPDRRSTIAPRKWHWTSIKPACPVATSHRVEVWREPGRCPRCGNFLEKNVFPFRLWE